MAGQYVINFSDPGTATFTVYPHETDGPNSLSTPRPIVGVNTTSEHFRILGDFTYRFVAGFTFTVQNSTGNNGSWTVAGGGSTYNSGTNQTTIPVTGNVTSAVVDGEIVYTIPAHTSLKLPGRGTLNYGENLVENFLHLLENFAHDTAPDNPIEGQLWYDKSIPQLKIYNGTTWDAAGVPSIPNTEIVFGTGVGVSSNPALFFDPVGMAFWLDPPEVPAPGSSGITAASASSGSDSDGGSASLSAGYGDGIGNGGAVALTAGNGGITSGNGGDISINAGLSGDTAGNGGIVVINSGQSNSPNGNGGEIIVTAGGADSGDGGTITIQAGTADTGSGGNVSIRAGETNSGDAGIVEITGGTAVGANSTSGSVVIGGADAGGTDGSGGSVELQAGGATGSGDAGVVLIQGGVGEDTTGGDVEINAGSSTNSDGGSSNMRGGNGLSGGQVNLVGGAGSDGPGGEVVIIGGPAGGAGDETGGDITLTGGAPANGGSAGNVNIIGGQGNTADGGQVIITGGLSVFAEGGDVTISGGQSTAPGEAAGDVIIQGGTPIDGAGGSISILGRSGVSTGGPVDGGHVTIIAGDGSGPGTITIIAGNADTDDSVGGSVTIQAGNGNNAEDGGATLITGGTSGNVGGDGGNVTIVGGNGFDAGGMVQLQGGSASEGNGGDVQLFAQDGASAGATPHNGGSISLKAGANVNGGFDGQIIFNIANITQTDFAVGATKYSSTINSVVVKHGEYILAGQTTDGTQTELFTNNVGETRLILPDDTTWYYEVKVVARRIDANNESAAYKYEGAIDRNTGAATTATVAGNLETILAEDTAAWSVAVDADTTNGSLRIRVTGQAAKTIRWIAYVKTVEITG